MASNDSTKILLAEFQKLCNYITEYLTTRGVISSYEANQLRMQRSHKMRLESVLEHITSRPDSAHVVADLRNALLSEPSYAWFAEQLGTSAAGSGEDEVETQWHGEREEDELETTVSRLSTVLSMGAGVEPLECLEDGEELEEEAEEQCEDEQLCDEVGGLTVEWLGSLAEGDVIWGISCLDNRIYVVRNNMSVIEVYDSGDDDFRFAQNIPVVGLRNPIDLTACVRNGWLFVVDCLEDVKLNSKNPLIKAIGKLRSNSKVFRINPSTRQVTQWSVGDVARSVSVTSSTTVILTCYKSQKLSEFTADGKPVRTIALHKELSDPLHAVLQPNGEFIVSQGHGATSPHRVCKVYAKDKCPPTMTYGDGEDEDLNVPIQLAVYGDELILVTDTFNGRIVVLNSSLQLVRYISMSGGDTVTEQETDECDEEEEEDEEEDAAAAAAAAATNDDEQLKPFGVCVDESQSRIYVAFNNLEDDEATSKVIVYNIAF